MGPDSKVPIPITALSFEIPLMQYKYTSTQPLVIGKRQFEYGKFKFKLENLITI